MGLADLAGEEVIGVFIGGSLGAYALGNIIYCTIEAIREHRQDIHDRRHRDQHEPLGHNHSRKEGDVEMGGRRSIETLPNYEEPPKYSAVDEAGRMS